MENRHPPAASVAGMFLLLGFAGRVVPAFIPQDAKTGVNKTIGYFQFLLPAWMTNRKEKRV
jgi:hypothetical protein